MHTNHTIPVHGAAGLIGTIDRHEWELHTPRLYLTLTNGQRVLLRSSLLVLRDGVAHLESDADHAVHTVQAAPPPPVKFVTAATAPAALSSAPASSSVQAPSAPARSAEAPPLPLEPPPHHHGARGDWAAQTVVPVVQEDLKVETRTVTDTVRVHKRVREREAVADPALLRENVEVERVPINRIVEQAPGTRQEGETLVIPVMEEVLVVEKRLMLREEIRVTTRRTETHDPQKITLRYEEVEVERVPADGSHAEPDPPGKNPGGS